LHIVRALVFIGVVAVAALLLCRSSGRLKPTVEHSVTSGTASTDGTAEFDPEWLLAHRSRLELSRRQVEELEKLQDSYQRTVSVLTRESEAEGRKLATLLDEAKGHGGIASSQLQAGLDESAQAVAEIAQARRRYREAARSLLTAKQQGILLADQTDG
jgi:hypothetical protein